MLIRISLILAIVAGLAAGVVNFAVVKNKIDVLTADRNDQRTQKEQFHTQLVSTQNDLKKTKDDLAQTQQQLTQTQGERDDALHKLTAANTQIQDLTTRLTKTTQDRDLAQGQLAAYQATGKTAAQVEALDKTLQQTQEALDVANQEKAILARTARSLQSQLNELLIQGYVVALPAGLKGQVMAVDPKWDFVVLNIGENQGVLKDGEMLVSRDGKLVAKVIIRSVEHDRCIANMVPGWKLGDVYEGDQVIPAHPASS